MSGLTLYTYDRKNWDAIVEKIQLKSIKILTAQEMNFIEAVRSTPRKEGESIIIPPFDQEYYDFSLLISGDNERVDVWSGHFITVLQLVGDEIERKKLIVDKKYASDIQNILFYFFSDSEPLEKLLELDDRTVTNIVDCKDDAITKLEGFLNEHLFGNAKFKIRLIQEIKRFRLFKALL